jgi:hypothetical protein
MMSTKGFGTTWKKNRELMMKVCAPNIAKAIHAASISPNRPSIRPYHCHECGKDIMGCGAAGQHRKKSGHRVERV